MLPALVSFALAFSAPTAIVAPSAALAPAAPARAFSPQLFFNTAPKGEAVEERVHLFPQTPRS